MAIYGHMVAVSIISNLGRRTEIDYLVKASSINFIKLFRLIFSFFLPFGQSKCCDDHYLAVFFLVLLSEE